MRRTWSEVHVLLEQCEWSFSQAAQSFRLIYLPWVQAGTTQAGLAILRTPFSFPLMILMDADRSLTLQDYIIYMGLWDCEATLSKTKDLSAPNTLILQNSYTPPQGLSAAPSSSFLQQSMIRSLIPGLSTTHLSLPLSVALRHSAVIVPCSPFS